MSEIPQPQSKRRRSEAPRTPKITLETVAQAAAFRTQGMSLTRALSMIHPKLTLRSWNDAVKRRPFLSQLFHAKESEGIAALLAEIRRGDKNWQARAWLLERAFNEEYANRMARSDPANVQIVIGLDETIRRRAAELAQRPPPRALPSPLPEEPGQS